MNEITQKICEYLVEVPGVISQAVANSEGVSDEDILKMAINNTLETDYECDLDTLPQQTDTLAGLPFELIPIDLFSAAMEMAVREIDWTAVANDPEVAQMLREAQQSQHT